VKHNQNYKNQPTLTGWLAFSQEKKLLTLRPLHKSRHAFIQK